MRRRTWGNSNPSRQLQKSTLLRCFPYSAAPYCRPARRSPQRRRRSSLPLQILLNLKLRQAHGAPLEWMHKPKPLPNSSAATVAPPPVTGRHLRLCCCWPSKRQTEKENKKRVIDFPLWLGIRRDKGAGDGPTSENCVCRFQARWYAKTIEVV